MIPKENASEMQEFLQEIYDALCEISSDPVRLIFYIGKLDQYIIDHTEIEFFKPPPSIPS